LNTQNTVHLDTISNNADALTALFIIDTPSQVFNLKEALAIYNVVSYDIIICDCCRADAYQQLLTLLSTLSPRHLLSVPRESGAIEDRIGIYAQHLPFLREQNYQLVFFSNIRQQWQRDLVCSLPSRRKVLMDDGNATLVFYRYLFCQQQFFDFPVDQDVDRAIRAAATRRLYDIDVKQPPRLELFSIFSLPALPWLSIQHNPLQALNRFHQQTNPAQMIFLGGGETELKFILEDAYIKLIQQVAALYPERDISYLPHRTASPELLARIRAEVRMTVVELKQPIENWILQHPRPPMHIGGFYSMALSTCAMCFGALHVTCFDPGMPTWQGAKSSHVWNLTHCNNYQVIECVMDYMKTMENIRLVFLPSIFDTQSLLANES
jgi:hypothetical protein